MWAHGPVAAIDILMSVAPVTTKGREDRHEQSWAHPSMAIPLGRTDPAPHWLKHLKEQVLCLAWTVREE